MKIIDLRSDTVTFPTPEMREAMARADVGDDVMGEDPSINRLQELAAERMGKEAALFLPSGTMGNLAAVMAHCGRGDEVILGNQSHTFLFEGGGIAYLAGVHSYELPNLPDGRLDLQAVRDALRSDDVHYPVSRLLVLENTHNRCGGTVLPLEYMDAAAETAHSLGLSLHIDGARIFNAAVALDVPANRLVQGADSITFCLSKGLSAPVGSVLCGTRDFINKARRMRKHLGGGMRQAGVLAAAGIVALEKMVTRLGEDHKHAQALAKGLAGVDGVIVETPVPATNMVFVHLSDAVKADTKGVVQSLAGLNVKVGVVGSRRYRLVTHYGIEAGDIQTVVEAFRSVLQ
ncbi:MAG: low-specificity L-threonine aldolase [Anaerolineae bacterium]|nr:low-specificity L-threonine aldolase [Anaerolineae bacterium]